MMTRIGRCKAFLLFAVLATAGLQGSTGAETAMRGMVASVHPLATEAGLEVLKNGGNAIDAAVAVGMTLGVVDVDNSGIGGGCFILIRRANGKLVAIDGRETAPMAATRDMFVRDGKGNTELSQIGALASGVPGALAAYEYACKEYGRKRFRDLVLPAAALAERGFVLSASYAYRLKAEAKEMERFESSREVFYRNGNPVGAGEVLKQPDLAATYRAIAHEGSRWFYRGPFAKYVERWMKDNGGIMSERDFREYKIQLRQPIISSYRGYTLAAFPPPSSGGVHVAQILNMLQQFDLKSMDEATRLHVIAEAMKRAFADRAFWLGDPDFVKVPRGLVDTNYAAALAANIVRERTTPVKSHGTPPSYEDNVFKKHTTHFSVADAEGNWVACTATVNTSFGSKVVIPGTGVVMNNQMDDFSAQPGVANYFGLVGAEANAVAPGKRPLSSMSPTIVMKNGRPIIALGAAGGPTIISQVVLELVDMLDLGMTPTQAVSAPRIHHQWSPDELVVEGTLPRELQDALEAHGHKLKHLSSMGVSQIVARAPDGRGFLGAADPRAGGQASGW
jgi:gamma-glutamyltranspeptidase/glutathione hydrolase